MSHDGNVRSRQAGGRGLRRKNGFTLVEVLIAIAVTSFALISILGLMTYASQVVRQSDKNARLAVVSAQMLATLGTQSYYVAKTNATIYYFTYEGLPTNSTGAYYQCNTTNLAPSSFPLEDVFGTPLMAPMQIIIRWPAPAGSAGFINTNSLTTAIANYD